jgi:hypothetical protein
VSTPPGPPFVDVLQQQAFLVRHYLGAEGFVRDGGSKLKCVTGLPGSGKTRWLQELLAQARTMGFATAAVDAAQAFVGGATSIDGLYRAVLAAGPAPWDVVHRLTAGLLPRLGVDPHALGEGLSYREWSLAQGRPPELVAREVGTLLEREVYADPHLERSFALAVMRMGRSALGAADVSPEQREQLAAWLAGRPLAARDRHRLALRRAVDRTSARGMLRSWLHLLRRAGFAGLVVAVDNLDVLLEGGGASGAPRPSRSQRDDFYEALRELIDDMDTMEGLLLVLAGTHVAFDDARLGLRSYHALWLRLQNEVVTPPESREINRFQDIIDLERLWTAAGVEGLVALAQAWSQSWGAPQPEASVRPWAEALAGLLAQRSGSVGLVRRVEQWLAARQAAAAGDPTAAVEGAMAGDAAPGPA